MSSNFTFQKLKKDGSYNIRDGYFVFNIKLHPKLQCQCSKQYSKQSNKMCKHLVFILYNVLKLSSFVINNLYILYLIEDYEINLENSENELRNKILNKINENVCGFCLDVLIKPNTIQQLDQNPDSNIDLGLHECNECNKFVHAKCYYQWISACKKNKVTESCIYCRVEKA